MIITKTIDMLSNNNDDDNDTDNDNNDVNSQSA